MFKKTFLIILDGWGKGLVPERDAIAQANTPFIDSLYKKYSNSELITYGEEVGLPEGQMGNSEVGHLNIGAGRNVYQDLLRINLEIKNDNLKNNKVLKKAVKYALKKDKPIHLLGLVSDGGVHSHIEHLKYLIKVFDKSGVRDTFIHAIMDGRDTDPYSGKGFIEDLNGYIKGKKAEITSIIGRYYAMDRDKRWDRIKFAYDLLVKGEGKTYSDPVEAMTSSYKNKLTDEFIKPMINEAKKGLIEEGDVVLLFNFRGDRPREITTVLTQGEVEGMKPIPLYYMTMTSYDDSFKGLHVIFEKEIVKDTIGEVISSLGLNQVRIAETEKYAHVTYFFSGGREEPFENEKRILIPPPKVATYDLKPEMSAFEVKDAIIKEIKTNTPDFITLNFANADMVGHTGVMSAAKEAVEAVDKCLEELSEVALNKDYDIIIIADHGNSDNIKNEDGSPNTAHSMNPVPCIYLSKAPIGELKNGYLRDIAPTLLEIMGIEKPTSMDGESLFKK